MSKRKRKCPECNVIQIPKGRNVNGAARVQCVDCGYIGRSAEFPKVKHTRRRSFGTAPRPRDK